MKTQYTKEELNVLFANGIVVVKVIYYKRSGKWYSQGLVEIPARWHIWDDDFLLKLDAKQEILSKSAYRGFYVSISDELYHNEPNYNLFFNQLYHPTE